MPDDTPQPFPTGLLDLSSVDLGQLLANQGSNLAVAVKRARDEAKAADRDDGISAFNSSF